VKKNYKSLMPKKGGINMRKSRGFTLIELLIVVAIIAILAAIAVPNFLEAQTRSKVSRVMADHRSIATGLEAYYIDNNQYPVCQEGANTVSDGFGGAGLCSNANLGAISNPSFAINNGTTTRFRTLTTPSAFITSLFYDPFANKKNVVFGYAAINGGNGTNPGPGLFGSGWILTSYGPDTDMSSGTPVGGQVGAFIGWGNDLTLGIPATPSSSNRETLYNPGISQPSIGLIVNLYDSTNGTTSAGDIVRVKQ
jgi:prepilin-type N-terminal cleavage/methylation domain-containing protein